MADVCRPNLTRGDIRSAQNPQPPDDRTYSAEVTSLRSNLPLHRICAHLSSIARPYIILHAAVNVKHFLQLFLVFFCFGKIDMKSAAERYGFRKFDRFRLPCPPAPSGMALSPVRTPVTEGARREVFSALHQFRCIQMIGTAFSPSQLR